LLEMAILRQLFTESNDSTCEICGVPRNFSSGPELI